MYKYGNTNIFVFGSQGNFLSLAFWAHLKNRMTAGKGLRTIELNFKNVLSSRFVLHKKTLIAAPPAHADTVFELRNKVIPVLVL